MFKAYCEALRNCANILFSKQLIKFYRILGVSKKASIGNVLFRSSAEKAIAAKLQIYL